MSALRSRSGRCVTAGLAGRLLKGTSGATSILTRSAGEAGTQVDGGAGGEVVAQALTGEYEPGEIALESVAELGPGAVETALNLTKRAGQTAPQQTPERKSAQDRIPPTGPTIPRPSRAPLSDPSGNC